ncbi:ribosome alternative rescue factor ArfA [Vreelandella andesensis]|uniref:Ribosome alternative rescue factor ArfA n=1 Tax=Vreelandella andesensis TaxID=447567 RepID=A0A3S0WAZ9_9GAMM|nr:alternative ribosome rescue factor ArfA [Halomonas andesensis]RUR33340.1 ribosome alternative rescue factor ArfA [Halomonas andesensis]
MKKGKIRDNALKAQLRTPMFKMQQQTPKKGKGSYSRKGSSNKVCSHKGNMAGRGHRQAA